MRVFLFAISLFVVGCGGASGEPENRLIYADVVAREMLIESLKARGIPHRVDHDGGVWYPAREVRMVDEVAAEILKKRFGPAVSYDDPVDLDSLKRRLTEAGIRYESRVQNGREKVAWLKKDEKRVMKILEAVDKESMERSKVERERKSAQSKVPGSN